MIDIIKKQWIGIVALVFVAFSGLFGGAAVETAVDALGSSEVTTISNPHVFSNTVTLSGAVSATGETVVDGFTQGGGVLNVIDANGGTYTLTQAEMLASNVLEMNAGGAGQAVIALTLPATSTMTTLIPTAGDMREWIIDASALSAPTTTTITLGTGVNLIAVTTADDVIDGAEFARLTCWREEDTDVSCIVSELLAAD